MQQDDKESYLLLLLSDANLPTGSFVASAGLESTAAHALFHVPGPPGSDILAFLRSSVDTYARSALPFARDAHRIVVAYTTSSGSETPKSELDKALTALTRLDALYDASTLNHIARRASCAQGAALLTLYTRGFATPPELLKKNDSDGAAAAAAATLVAALKLLVRRGESDGHLPVCWGVLTGALGLTVGEQASNFSSRLATANIYYRACRTLAPFPSCARRVVCCGTYEYPRPVCGTAVIVACGASCG
jgi:urease accessory protein